MPFTFQSLEDGYNRNWANLQIRPRIVAQAKKTAARLLNGKDTYQQIEAKTGVPWYFIGLCHFRESDFDFNTYLGNGQPLDRVTTEVPRGRGPFPSFVNGAVDALRIQGLVGASDWSIARILFRLEGLNGFGYQSHGVNSPYLYGGSTLYGPPEAKGGRYNGVFDPGVVDTQLGTAVILKALTGLDSSIKFDAPPALGFSEPDDERAKDVLVVQRALNALGASPALAEDGVMGPKTMTAVALFQQQNNLTPANGLLGAATIAAILKMAAPAPLQQQPQPPQQQQPQLPVPADVAGVLQRIENVLTQIQSGNSNLRSTDPAMLLQRLLALNVGQTPAQLPAPANDQLSQVMKVLNVLLSRDRTPALGQVNGALGDTIGNLLNGKKSALGIGGSLLTALLMNVPTDAGAVAQGGALIKMLAPIVGAVPGLGQVALPLFLAMGAWGVLGKLEKWAQPWLQFAPQPQVPAEVIRALLRIEDLRTQIQSGAPPNVGQNPGSAPPTSNDQLGQVIKLLSVILGQTATPAPSALARIGDWAVRSVAAAGRVLSRWRGYSKTEDRRVDLALLKMDGSSAAVTEEEALLAQAHYCVRVHIGERLPESLLPEPPPPIAPLLTESQSGHELEVAIFGKDFAVVGPTTRPLFLPSEGASKQIYFEIAAPEQPGPAQFRVGIYHQNHLVQSFVFGGVVAGSSEQADRPRARFLLEFSRTANFKNLTALAPRGLSIGLNANGSATHGLFVKAIGGTAEFSLPQQLLQDQVTKFRDLLQQATFISPGQARFSTYPDPSDGISPDFHKYAAQFADYGHELHRALLGRPDLLLSLRKLADSEGETIQVVRFDPNFVLPWAAIYDFTLPTPIEGAPVPEVCRGVKVDADGKEVACGHRRGDKVYCINGFWGVRHVVEELIGSGSGVDAVAEIVRTSSDGAVRVAVDAPEPHTDEMGQIFEKEMGKSYAPVTSGDVLLDLLWKDAERPALLVVLGHLETKPIRDQPIGPRIVLPKGGWLLPGEITDRVLEKTWDQPRTLVLLMGCQTALVDLGSLVGFGTAFNSARAAGIAGTEVVAFSRLLTRFAQDITLSLWKKEKLGAAISAFRRRLLVAGNPLAFVFQALGGADIHLKIGK
ncbi:peptidoglycan-binding protein [Bradyrhizobium sp. McL0615]|uniref:peptidoglycan-binding protein n=1 Tax=Bradyrhizobium sp. McL0615 TaxID=3415673 RepID=UPI003CF645E8